jgi:hypothetical protein
MNVSLPFHEPLKDSSQAARVVRTRRGRIKSGRFSRTRSAAYPGAPANAVSPFVPSLSKREWLNRLPGSTSSLPERLNLILLCQIMLKRVILAWKRVSSAMDGRPKSIQAEPGFRQSVPE